MLLRYGKSAFKFAIRSGVHICIDGSLAMNPQRKKFIIATGYCIKRLTIPLQIMKENNSFGTQYTDKKCYNPFLFSQHRM